MTYFDFRSNKFLQDLPESFPISFDIVDKFTHYIQLTPEQEAFHLANPSASLMEVYNRQLLDAEEIIVDAADLADLRSKAYTAEIDKHLIAYQGYILEGDTEKAELQRLIYLAKKAEIREIYSEEV